MSIIDASSTLRSVDSAADTPSKLMVFIPDRLSDLARKGEIIDRYYNPGDLFDEVHILPTNNDVVNLDWVQKTVGSARVFVHNHPLPSYRATLGWRPLFLRKWLAEGVRLAERIGPCLLRTHGNYVNGLLAATVKKQLGTPMVTSLHTHPDVDLRGVVPWRQLGARLFCESLTGFERATLQAADVVLPVYKSIVPYAERYAKGRVRIAYNFVNPTHIQTKTDYSARKPVRIVSVGRQFEQKNPENIIRALKHLGASLTLIGDGPIHARLVEIARTEGVTDRVTFVRSMANDDVCRKLPEFDLFAVHIDSFGISKAIIEALLTGLPVVVNRRHSEPVHELEGDWVHLIENTPEGYAEGLQHLISDESARQTLGKEARSTAWKRYSPIACENRFARIYCDLVPGLTPPPLPESIPDCGTEAPRSHTIIDQQE